MQEAINTNTHTFLLSFRNTNRKYIISDTEVLGNILISQPNNVVKNIKKFDNSKDKFVRLSKSDLNTFSSWDTVTNEELKKRNLI